MGPCHVPSLWVREDLGSSAMKGYLTFPRAPGLKLYHQLFSVIYRTLIDVNDSSLQRCNQCILLLLPIQLKDYIYIYIYIYIYMCVCVCVCVCVCMCARACVYVCVRMCLFALNIRHSHIDLTSILVQVFHFSHWLVPTFVNVFPLNYPTYRRPICWFILHQIQCFITNLSHRVIIFVFL